MRDSSKRCSGCYLPSKQCMCQQITPTSSRLEVLILRHVLECERNSNTGRLVAAGLGSAQILEYANPERPFARALLGRPNTFLLYPQPGARVPARLPERLVVLDASWPQARRMAQRIPELRGMPRVALPSPSAALPRMRAGAKPEQMSTAESVIAALRLFGDAAAAEHLEGLLTELVRRFALPGRTGPNRDSKRAK